MLSWVITFICSEKKKVLKSNDLTFYLQKLGKEIKPKASRNDEVIKIRAEVNGMKNGPENGENYHHKLGSLKKLIKIKSY